jgi:hypothetical protein
MNRLLLPLLLIPAAAHAVVLDGRLDAEYGPAIVLQTTQTSFGNNPAGFGGADSTAWSFGSELDGAYGFVAGGSLHLFVSGNLLANMGEFDHRQQLHLFFDTRPGGQHVLRADNADVGYWPDSKLNKLAGLTFDAGFAADWWLDVLVLEGANPVHAYAADLLDAGGGAGGFLGSGSAGGPGDLTGGANPGAIKVTVDNSNSLGVGSGCGSAMGAETATRGIEWEIPLAALGNPPGPIRICAFQGGVYNSAGLDDQVLGPIPPGTCFLGMPAGVDFSAIAGDQFFTIGNGATPARAASWGRLKAAYR